MPEAHSLSEFMAESISEQRVVGLSGMDELNLAPDVQFICLGCIPWKQNHLCKTQLPFQTYLP